MSQGGNWREQGSSSSSNNRNQQQQQPNHRRGWNHSNYRSDNQRRQSGRGGANQRRPSEREEQVRSEALSDLPGFSFDVVTQKYYKILPNAPGQPSGSTRSDMNSLNNEHRTKQRIQKLYSTTESAGGNKSILPGLLREMEIGRQGCVFPFLPAKRKIEEQRIRGLRGIPSYSFEVNDTASHDYSGCQFLDVKERGRALIGCWGVQPRSCDYPSHSHVVSYKVFVDRTLAESESRRRQSGRTAILGTNGRPSSNTYGLRFEPVDNCIHVDSTLVDMSIAPADSDVTVICFATAGAVYIRDKIATRCTIFLRAVDQLTKEEAKDSMSSPIYNCEWMTNEPIWSCCFDANHMRIGVGMEKCAAVFEVLNESKFKVSSGGKNVIAQQYSREGNTLYLGRLRANISSLDLRMSYNHTIGEFENSNSACFIRQMENRPNQLLSDDFDGKLRLWDNRTRTCMLEFEGHKNSSHKVPCFVDEEERCVFAVGEDSVARGWSLKSGELLCSIDCPRSLQTHSDFPRLVYSDRWGGLNGNAAIILSGVKGDLSVHELPMI